MKKSIITKPFLLLFALLFPLVLLSSYAAAAEESGEPGAEPYDLSYVDMLFDTSYVHTIDIRLTDSDWDDFIANCTDKAYRACDVTIDGEEVTNVAIRAKGNSSMKMVGDGVKYSFKIAFDRFEDKTYHGLDKLNLNNMVKDDTSMHDYLVYQTMAQFGVNAPLCSYIFVTVNGEDFGLYLALEDVKDAFLERNYGDDYGDLYKPDSISLDDNGGNASEEAASEESSASEEIDSASEETDSVLGTDDTKLLYIDDDPASYPYIFDNAETDVTEEDQTRLIDSLRRLNAREDLENTVNIDEVLRYFAAHIFVCNSDSYTGTMIHNYFLYEDNGILSMIPWDYNQAYGESGDDINSPIDTPTVGSLEELPMIAWIFADPAYTEQYHAVYREFIEDLCDSGWMEETIRSTEELIAPYVARDPNAFVTEDVFHDAVDTLSVFCRLRAESIQGQLDGTVPSTDEAQAAEPEKLVDTTELADFYVSYRGGPAAE